MTLSRASLDFESPSSVALTSPFTMSQPEPRDVDQILLNARLRDELEPYLDESIELVTVRGKPTSFENEYLESMLAWERAPIVPIAEWFDPPLALPRPETLSPEELREGLWTLIERLYEKRIVLDYTDHLSDRELYCLILRDILPSPEKKLPSRGNALHWHCMDPQDDADPWLKYYATNEERVRWQDETGMALPPRGMPPYPRSLPR